MSSPDILFSVEEAFRRLGESKARGSLVIFAGQESIHVFVEEGAVVWIKGSEKTGEDALAHALALEQASYRWMPEAEPTERSAPIDIQDYLAKRSQGRDESRFKTIRMANYTRKERKPDFHYFFIPEEAPTSKLRLKKVSTVVGREPSCDLAIESFQVSRRHCLLQINDRGLLVKDLDSTNGTFVNGIPLTDGYINDGDRLSLGTYVMMLRREKM